MKGGAPAASASRRAATAVLIGLIALTVTALVVRAAFVWRSGPYAATSVFEEISLYNIWKARHGLPLYEWPLRDHWLLTSYNFGFYQVYGAWNRLWRCDGESLVACSRWLTLIASCAGAALQVVVVRQMLSRETRIGHGLWIWGLAFLTWFSAGFSAWANLTARPDMLGVALALGGLASVLRARRFGPSGWWLIGSLLFFAAWCCKQSIVWIFAGTLLWCFREREGWGSWWRLAAPFALLSALCLGLGGAEYRFNLFGVPAIYRWSAGSVPRLLLYGVGLNLFFWLLGGWAVVEGLRLPARGWTPLAWISLPPILMGVCQLALHGSGLSNLFEGFVAAAMVATASWLELWRGASTRRCWLGAGLLLSMTALPAVQLVLAARAAPEVAVGRSSLHNLNKLDREQLAQRRRFGQWLRTAPKPVWIADPMLALPWFATDNTYPALLFDPEFMDDARAKGLLPTEAIVMRLVRERYFAAVILNPSSRLAALCREAGYLPAPPGAGPDPLVSADGWKGPNRILLLRSNRQAGVIPGSFPK